MIGLVLRMISARRAQAVTLFLLATVAVAAAVAGPVATRATDAAIVRLEVAHAAHDERSLSAIGYLDPSDARAANQFDNLSLFVTLPGFDVYRGGEVSVFGPTADASQVASVTDGRVVFRERLCEHVTIVAGRCFAGALDVIIGEQAARRSGLAPGDAATVQASTFDDDGNIVPAGLPSTVIVVGVYRATDLSDPYWLGRRFLRVSSDGTLEEPVFTTPATVGLIDHHAGGTVYLDAVAPDGVLTPQRLEEIPDEVMQARASLSSVSGIVVSTRLTELTERVQTSRDLARQLGPVAFIPLAALSLFVIYLAVGYGVFGRRGEVGLVALRGVSRPRRWLLAGGETVLPILVGAPVGYVLGHLGVGLVARLRLGSTDGAQLDGEGLPYAGLALFAALAVALFGLRRVLAEPVVELLRGVPRGVPVWQALAVEALVVALAVVATLQLRGSAGGVTGIGLLVPGLLVVAVALLAARVNVAATGVVARVALWRGLLGSGLSAVQLARRPGGARLFVLLAVGTGMLSFVAAGTDVAAQAREDRATVITGAPWVLTVDGTDARRLLAATREVDPEGAWAMAAAVIQPSEPENPVLLALDTSRLPAVAAWRPEFGADVATLAAALAPGADPGYAPFELRGGSLEIDVDISVLQFLGGQTAPPVTIQFELVNFAGRRVRSVTPVLAEGHHVLEVPARGCEDGCRLAGFAIQNSDVATQVELRGLYQPESGVPVVPPAALGDRHRWRISRNVNLLTVGETLAVRMQPQGFAQDDLRVGVLDAPTPVPVAAAEARGPVRRVTSLDREDIETEQVLSLSLLPRLGTRGVVADLRYLERTLLDAPQRETAEIWLGPAAPADAIDRFRDVGLLVTRADTAVAAREALERQGPALALQFHLAAAVFCVLLALGGLGLVAAVDRRARVADLRALRVQGLRKRMVRRAALWGYLSIVVLAALAGLLGAAVAWAFAGDRMPIFTDTSSVLSPPRWPAWLAVVRPWALATAAMVVASVVAAWALRRTIVRGNGNGGVR